PSRGGVAGIQPLACSGAVRRAAMRHPLNGGWAWERIRAPSRQRRPSSLPAGRPPVRRRGPDPFLSPAAVLPAFEAVLTLGTLYIAWALDDPQPISLSA